MTSFPLRPLAPLGSLENLPRSGFNTDHVASNAFSAFGGAAPIPQRGAKSGASAPNFSTDIPESLLLRDIIYVFQAIDGEHIKYNSRKDCYMIVDEVGVDLPTRNLVLHICELGWLYRRTLAYTNETTASPDAGLVEQSFCAALQKELTDYYQLIALLDSQVKDDLGGIGHEENANALTLKRLYVWVQDPMERMRVLATLSDTARGLRGGALVAAIRAQLRTGAPFVEKFVLRITKQASVPLFQMVSSWITIGELEDPYREFFVEQHDQVDAHLLWTDKHTIRRSMLPTFISNDIAGKILNIGKSIHFIRHCCDDARWVSKAKIRPVDLQTDEDESDQSDTLIDLAASAANERLLELILGKYEFQAHCQTIKNYMLLEQGNFAEALLDHIGPMLDKEPTRVSSHNVDPIIQNCLNMVDPAYDETDHARRLQFNRLQMSHGDSGWDIFSLRYHVSSPLDVIFTPKAMDEYTRIFNFIWRIKRVQRLLSNAWKRQLGASRRKVKIPKVQAVLRMVSLMCQKMRHFVGTIQAYIRFDVLDTSWSVFCKAVKNARDFDSLIAAHNAHVQQICQGAFLGQGPQVLKKLQIILNLILHVCQLNEKFHDDIVECYAQIDIYRQESRQREARGEWAQDTETDEREKAVLNKLRQLSQKFDESLDTNSARYQVRIEDFLPELRTQTSGSGDRLARQLNFNKFFHERPTAATLARSRHLGGRHSQHSHAASASIPASQNRQRPSSSRAAPASHTPGTHRHTRSQPSKPISSMSMPSSPEHTYTSLHADGGGVAGPTVPSLPTGGLTGSVAGEERFTARSSVHHEEYDRDGFRRPRSRGGAPAGGGGYADLHSEPVPSRPTSKRAKSLASKSIHTTSSPRGASSYEARRAQLKSASSHNIQRGDGNGTSSGRPVVHHQMKSLMHDSGATGDASSKPSHRARPRGSSGSSYRGGL